MANLAAAPTPHPSRRPACSRPTQDEEKKSEFVPRLSSFHVAQRERTPLLTPLRPYLACLAKTPRRALPLQNRLWPRWTLDHSFAESVMGPKALSPARFISPPRCPTYSLPSIGPTCGGSLSR